MFIRRLKQSPRIAITTAERGNKTAVAAIKLAIRMAGGQPITVSSTRNTDQIRSVQGLVLAGGTDINPALYGGVPRTDFQYDVNRDALELDCAKFAMQAKLPVIGICRGAQMLNVAAGGSLHQNLSEAYEGFLPTRSLAAKIFERRAIEVSKGSQLAAVMGSPSKLWVNSIHKQGIHEIGNGLKVVARDALGVVQALEATDPMHFAVGVQWHPEFLIYAAKQRKLFEMLVDQASNPSSMQSFEGAVTVL